MGDDCWSALYDKASTVALATGKNIPFDAGRYNLCHNDTTLQYFLVKGNAKMGMISSMSTVPVELGLCLPRSCNRTNVFDVIEDWDKIGLGFPINITSVYGAEDEQTAGIGMWFATAFCCLLSIWVLCATLLRNTSVHNSSLKSEPLLGNELRDSTSSLQNRFVTSGGLVESVEERGSLKERIAQHWFTKSFDAVVNWKKLMSIPPSKNTDSLNGLRVLSMLWIVLGHSFLMPEAIAGYDNPEDVMANPWGAKNKSWLQLICGAELSVDTFFYISGFLITFGSLKKMKTSSPPGKWSVSAALLYRYFRLTPSLLFALLCYYKIFMYIGSGPFFARYQHSVTRRCDNSWWVEPLYIMNFYPASSDDLCMGWTWYLGNDFIFFAISAFLMPFFYRQRKMYSVVAVGLLIAVSFAVTTYLVLHYSLSVYIFDSHYTKYSYYAYSKPYTRFPAYGVGVLFALFMESRPARIEVKNYQNYSSSAMVDVFHVIFVGILLFLTIIPVTDFTDEANNWG
eukprot:g3105.t1